MKKGFIFGFLSVLCLYSVLLLGVSCTRLQDSTQSNTTNSTVSTNFGDFDIL